MEGSSNNKALEIFNETGATVDLAQYQVRLGSNGGNWSTTYILNPTGSLVNNDVYVVVHPQANAAMLAVSDISSTVTNVNGDDALGLLHNGVLIDIIGIYQTDPGVGWPVAGVADATLNHTLIRKPTVIAGSLDWTVTAGTDADNSQWLVQPVDYITDLGMHTFTPPGGNSVVTPTFNPPSGVYNSPINVVISTTTPNASIYYTTDGTLPTTASTPYTGPIAINASTTVKALATATGFDPSSIATAIYTFPVIVANLSALRNSPADANTIYQVSGEIFLSYKQIYRSQKFFQDDAAGILIDDLAGIITTVYNVGDGVIGISGKLSEYGGMLQFIPTTNGPVPSSTGNAITPVITTYSQLISNFDTYESRLIKIAGVSFPGATGVFANGIVYPSSDQSGSFGFRTTFYDMDYIGAPIPTSPKDIIGIPNSRVDGTYFTARSLADFQEPGVNVQAPEFSQAPGTYYESVTVGISCGSANAQIYYTTNGNDPDNASIPYSAPILINSDTTLKAIAYVGTVSSTISIAFYDIETLPIDHLAPDFISGVVLSYTEVALQWGYNEQLPSYHTGFSVYRDGVAIYTGIGLNMVDVVSPGTYQYYATSWYSDNVESLPCQTITVITNVANEDNIAGVTTRLLGNFPNPFKPHTTISYQVKDNSPVAVDIFNIRGQLVRSFQLGNQSRGAYNLVWDGKDESGRASGNGVYYYRLTAKDHSETRKMLMLK